jgi:two-component system response regulator CpxR
MSIIAAFSASYCPADDILRNVAGALNYRFVAQELFEEAARCYKLPGKIVKAADQGNDALIKNIEKDSLKNISYIKAALAEIAIKDNFVLHGIVSALFPKDISHILRVCFAADLGYRSRELSKTRGISEKDALSIIKKEDRTLAEWTHQHASHGPWDEKYYDIVIPLNSTSSEEAVRLILEQVNTDVIKTTAESQKAMNDFLLATKVKVLLAEKKHDVDVEADAGLVAITLKKYVVRLNSLKDELRKIAMSAEGVKEVEFKIGPQFKMPSTWPPVDIELPKKVLLVDDEKEFVQTLSDRLQRRKITSAIAYDGEEALSFAVKDQPEVMVLDLKMPGIDGIEVLRRIKRDHPATEVIILTGHGSDRERDLALQLGAFAYLEKPVDVDVLARTMKDAYARMNSRRGIGEKEK